MARDTVTARENAAIDFGARATHGAIYTAKSAGSAGTEPTGGSPAYARKPLTWTPGAVDGTSTATATFDVPPSTQIVGAGVHTALTGGTYLDGLTFGTPVPSQTGQSTLTVTFTDTEQ